MNVLEFGKTQKRMCVSYYNCTQCPLNYGPCRIGNGTDEDDKKILEVVERWAKGHPAKTRQNEFLRVYPNARMSENEECLDICPLIIEKNNKCLQYGSCEKCMKDYWLEEIQ